MRIILFILLKIIELALIVFAPYYTGRLVLKILGEKTCKSVCWMLGLGIILMIPCLLFALLYIGESVWKFVPQLINTNWSLVESILE